MCPVCQARFRGASKCGRCGADLTAVMTLVASAWRMRQAARLAIAAGDPARARTLASRAEHICHTQAGRRLVALSAWLCGGGADGFVCQ
jgi:hypothetical protein